MEREQTYMDGFSECLKIIRDALKGDYDISLPTFADAHLTQAVREIVEFRELIPHESPYWLSRG